jgi:SpoVK/Ycf46/Vps4 family AAA+-type ATPase
LSQIFDIHSRAQNLDENLDKDVLIEEFSKKKFTGADVRAILSDAQEKAWERLGIYEKMEDNILTPEDIENVKIKQEDFRIALDKFEPIAKKNKRNPIGFNKQ